MTPAADDGGDGAVVSAGVVERGDVRTVARRASFGALVFVGPFRPSIAAANPASPYWRSFLVHVGGLLVLGLVSLAAAAACFAILSPTGITMFDPGGDVEEAAVATGLSLLGGCAAAPVLGVILSCWAWRLEPLGDTLRFSMRTVARVTPALTIPVAGGWLMVILYMLLEKVIYSAHQNFPWTAVPSILGGYGLGGWVIVIYLKALGAERVARGPESDAALCESCGYALVHLEGRPRCPECGLSVEYSLSKERRTESPADWARPRLRSPATWRLGAEAWFNPATLFERIRLDGALPWAWGLLWRCLALCWFLVPTVFLILMTAVVGGPLLRELPTILIFLFAAAGIPIAAVLVSWCTAVSILGLLASRKYGRNVLGPTTMVAGLLSGGLVVWAAVMVVVQFLVLVMADRLRLSNYVPYFEMLLGVANLCVIAFFATAVWRRLRWVGYGNWHISMSDGGCGMSDVRR